MMMIHSYEICLGVIIVCGILVLILVMYLVISIFL